MDVKDYITKIQNMIEDCAYWNLKIDYLVLSKEIYQQIFTWYGEESTVDLERQTRFGRIYGYNVLVVGVPDMIKVVINVPARDFTYRRDTGSG